jgi:branched-subunit amino acid ABC-type transport system permease component
VSEYLPFLVAGLVAGSLYGLAGLGLVLTFRTSGVFNFAHGAIAAGAAFVFYSLHDTQGLAWPLAAVITIAGFGLVVGPLLEAITRPLAGAADTVVVIGTVGLLLAVQGILYLIYGNAARNTPTFLPESGFTVSEVFISWAQVISVLVAAIGAAGLYLFLQRAPLGVAMRAVVDNPTLVDLSGSAPARIRRAGWALGSAVAAVAGILLAPTLSLDVNLLTLLVVQAFGACAFGFFSSLPLTFVGGMVIGVAAALATKVFTEQPLTGLPPTMPFLVLIAILLVAPVAKFPGGRAGRRNLVASPAAAKTPGHLAAAAVVAAILVAVPFVVDTKLPVWTTGLAYVVVFGSLALLTWGSGQLSLCHASFLAVGTTTMAWLSEQGVPWVPALLLAGLAAVPVGAVVAIPALRLSGIYLALATLGFGIFMQNVIYPSSLMFGVQLTATVPRPVLGSIDTSDGRTLYFVMLTTVVVCVAGILAFQRGRFGRLLGALAESPTMLSTHGLSTTTARLIVFCASAFFAGIGGALAVTQTGAASAVTFGPIQSLFYVAVLGIAGTRRLWSPLIAALLFSVLPGYASSFGSNRQLLVFGSVAVIAAVGLARRRDLADWVATAAHRSEFRRGRGPAAIPREVAPANPAAEVPA